MSPALAAETPKRTVRRSHAELAWLAGLLEGEGWFGLSRNRHKCPYPRVIMAMTDQDVILRAHAVGGVGDVRQRSRQEPHHKDSWAWQVARQRDAAGLMMTLYPFMGERRQARIREVLAVWRADVHPCRDVVLA